MKFSYSCLEGEFDENICKLVPIVTIEYLSIIIRKLNLNFETLTPQLGTTSLGIRISKSLF